LTGESQIPAAAANSWERTFETAVRGRNRKKIWACLRAREKREKYEKSDKNEKEKLQKVNQQPW